MNTDMGIRSPEEAPLVRTERPGEFNTTPAVEKLGSMYMPTSSEVATLEKIAEKLNSDAKTTENLLQNLVTEINQTSKAGQNLQDLKLKTSKTSDYAKFGAFFMIGMLILGSVILAGKISGLGLTSNVAVGTTSLSLGLVGLYKIADKMGVNHRKKQESEDSLNKEIFKLQTKINETFKDIGSSKLSELKTQIMADLLAIARGALPQTEVLKKCEKIMKATQSNQDLTVSQKIAFATFITSLRSL